MTAAGPGAAGVQYRVVWKREGLRPKRRVFARRGTADKFLLLFGPEPWRYLGKEPDEYVCCSGYQCGCGGETHRKHDEAVRATLPKLEWVRVESRPVGAWAPGAGGPGKEF